MQASAISAAACTACTAALTTLLATPPSTAAPATQVCSVQSEHGLSTHEGCSHDRSGVNSSRSALSLNCATTMLRCCWCVSRCLTRFQQASHSIPGLFQQQMSLFTWGGMWHLFLRSQGTHALHPGSAMTLTFHITDRYLPVLQMFTRYVAGRRHTQRRQHRRRDPPGHRSRHSRLQHRHCRRAVRSRGSISEITSCPTGPLAGLAAVGFVPLP